MTGNLERMGMKIPLKAGIVILFILWGLGCSTTIPVAIKEQPREAPKFFSHGDFSRVLKTFVDDQGMVDYSALKKDASDLEKYYLLLSEYSPDSHPRLFPTDQDRLAYWINAYNAAVIKIVLTYYPIDTVKDIKPPLLFFFLPRESGFFLFQKIRIGGEDMRLYTMENSIIRKRFNDPRIHFALNCASLGCPRLPRNAFVSGTLNQQLDDAARKFLSEDRNVNIDHEKGTVTLSSIFEWYRSDFLEWYRRKNPNEVATLQKYIGIHLSPDKRTEIMERTGAYSVKFSPYDWHLNDQKTTVHPVNEYSPVKDLEARCRVMAPFLRFQVSRPDHLKRLGHG